MTIHYNLLAAHTVLIRTALSPQKWMTRSPYTGLCALHQHHAVLVSRWSACATLLLETLNLLYTMDNLISWCFFMAAVVFQSALVSIVPLQPAVFPKVPSDRYERAEMKPWACMATKLHTTMASEPHPSGQTGDCHGCQSHTSPATGSAASLSQLHFLNTSVFSLTKLTDFLSCRGWPLETTSHWHGVNYLLKDTVLRGIHSALSISLRKLH